MRNKGKQVKSCKKKPSKSKIKSVWKKEGIETQFLKKWKLVETYWSQLLPWYITQGYRRPSVGKDFKQRSNRRLLVQNLVLLFAVIN